MLKKITSVFLTILILITGIFLTISFLLKWNLREKEIIRNLKNNDLSFLLQDRSGKEPVFVTEMRHFLEFVNIPSDTIDAVLNSDATKTFVGKYTHDFLNYLIYQENPASITKEDLKILAQANFKVIEQKLSENHKVFASNESQKILNFIDSYSGEVMNFFPTANQLLQKIDQGSITLYKDITLKDVTLSFQLFLSTPIICFALTLLLISFFLLLWIHRETQEYFSYFEAIFLIYIFLFVTVEIVLSTVLKDFLMNYWESANTFINYFINVLCKNLWFFLLLVTMALIVVSILAKKNKKKILTEC